MVGYEKCKKRKDNGKQRNFSNSYRKRDQTIKYICEISSAAKEKLNGKLV